jgi:hypothetical protein
VSDGCKQNESEHWSVQNTKKIELNFLFLRSEI